MVAGGELEDPLVDAVDSATMLVSTSIENVVVRADWRREAGLEAVSGGSRVKVKVGNKRRDDDAWFESDGSYYRNNVDGPGVEERKPAGWCSESRGGIQVQISAPELLEACGSRWRWVGRENGGGCRVRGTESV